MRRIIINADDFGASSGINRGIVEAHTEGVVTSASLMVTGAAVQEAIMLAHRCPKLSLGLHWDLTSPGHEVRDADARAKELRRQLELFERLVGHPPTHLDSHHHVHREDDLNETANELALRAGVPLRGDGQVTYIGGFYAQWEWQVTDLYYVSVDFLEHLLREQVADAWTEIGCHPGYANPPFDSVYTTEREAEVRTLTDPRVRRVIEALGLALSSYADYRPSKDRGEAHVS